MNALLLTACLLSADAGGAAPVAAAPAVVTGTGCGGGCGGCGPTCASSCEKASLFDRIRARFAKSNSCGCEKAPACGCEKAPKCKPACGTPLFSKPVFHGCTTSCKDTGCSSGCNDCDKPGLLDRLKAKFASRKHSSCDCAPACGGCGAAAPAGCSLPPAPNAPGAAPVAPGAPKTMPAPAPEKRTSSLIVPSIVTPTSGAIPAPMPIPVTGKSPF